MAVAEARRAVVEARIEGLSFAGTGWLGRARNGALARLKDLGLPTRRDEYWRYTDPATFTQATAPKAALFNPGDEPPLFDHRPGSSWSLSTACSMRQPRMTPGLPGVEIERLTEAGGREAHWAAEVYGILENAGQSPVPRPLAR